jgi:hypothetical protein
MFYLLHESNAAVAKLQLPLRPFEAARLRPFAFIPRKEIFTDAGRPKTTK